MFKWRSNCGAFFETFEIKDTEVAEFLKKHMRLIDRLSVDKVVAAAFYTFAMIQDDKNGTEKIEPGNWKFWFKKNGDFGWW